MREETNNIWVVLCQKTITDEQTKLISLVDVIEKLTVNVDEKYKKDMNVQIPLNFAICSYWNIAKEIRNKDLDLQIQFFSPKETVLGNIVVPFKTDKETHRFTLNVNGLLIKEPGTHTFKLSIKDKGKEQASAKTQMIVEFEELVKNTLDLNV